MASIPAGELFTVNWLDKYAVINLAKRLGKNMSVIKYANRQNYNITHTSELNRCRFRGEFTIIYQTQERKP